MLSISSITSEITCKGTNEMPRGVVDSLKAKRLLRDRGALAYARAAAPVTAAGVQTGSDRRLVYSNKENWTYKRGMQRFPKMSALSFIYNGSGRRGNGNGSGAAGGGGIPSGGGGGNTAVVLYVKASPVAPAPAQVGTEPCPSCGWGHVGKCALIGQIDSNPLDIPWKSCKA